MFKWTLIILFAVSVVGYATGAARLSADTETCPCGECADACGCCVGGECSCDGCDCSACESDACLASGADETESCCAGGTCTLDAAAPATEDSAVDACPCGFCDQGCGCCDDAADCSCSDCACPACSC